LETRLGGLLLAIAVVNDNLEGMRKLFLLFLLPAWSLAEIPANPVPPFLELPSSPRTMAMGGALVAVADDPQAGFLNPGGLRLVPTIGYDLSFSNATGEDYDNLCATLVNPATERGSAFGMGVWTQGLLENAEVRYYVPYSAVSWNLTGSGGLGVVARYPYRSSRMDSVDSRFEALADVTALQRIGAFRIGAAVERAIGGAADIAPRRIRAGAAYVAPEGVVVSYEWRGDETSRKYDFHYASSHWGAEITVGNYLALRGGFSDLNQNHVSFGVALGRLDKGWRLECAWDVPASHNGATRWSVGSGYRL